MASLWIVVASLILVCSVCNKEIVIKVGNRQTWSNDESLDVTCPDCGTVYHLELYASERH